MKISFALVLALLASPVFAQEGTSSTPASTMAPAAAAKPTTDAEKPASKDKQCGGFAGLKCDEGYVCKLEADHPDAMGICIKDGKGRSCGGGHDAACPKGTKCKGPKAKRVCK